MHHHPSRPFHGRRFARGGCGPEETAGRERHRGQHRHGMGGRRATRIFDHGELRLVVLSLIAEQPRHGYEIIKVIEDRLAGSYSPSPGVIYPTLTMLEELGHATVEETEGKKRYAITEAGRALLQAQRPAVETALARMNAVSATHGGGPAPELVRAMENLKLAMRLRLARGPLTGEQRQAIAGILDGAALAIERS